MATQDYIGFKIQHVEFRLKALPWVDGLDATPTRTNLPSKEKALISSQPRAATVQVASSQAKVTAILVLSLVLLCRLSDQTLELAVF